MAHLRQMRAELLMAARMVPEGGWGSRLKPERTPRVHKRSHLDFIKTLPCICCMVERAVEIQADDPMHIRTKSDLHGADGGGAGLKSDDRWTLPGCRTHHNEQHHGGDEQAFWRKYGIDPHLLALVLWGLSGYHHGAVQAMRHHTVSACWNRALEIARKGTTYDDD